MDFKTNYPDFAPIEQYVRRAKLERSVYLGHLIADFITSVTQGLKKLADSVGRGLSAEQDRRAVEGDAFLQRYVPRY